MKPATAAAAVVLVAGMALLLVSRNSGGAELGNAEHGKALYDESCAKCHGKTGAGDGRAGRELEHKPTPFNVKSKLSADDKLFKATKEGGKAVGQSGDMEAFPKLSDEQIHDVIAYLKTLAK